MESIYKSEEGERHILNQCRHLLERWLVPNEQFSVPACEGESYIINGIVNAGWSD